jgi:hypothetical protein
MCVMRNCTLREMRRFMCLIVTSMGSVTKTKNAGHVSIWMRRYSSVTHPRLALLTTRIYFPSVPRVALYEGMCHSLRRSASTSSESSTEISFVAASIRIRSSFLISAIGPPSCASGVIWQRHPFLDQRPQLPKSELASRAYPDLPSAPRSGSQ